jgi:predicted RNA-binding protein with PIN domain
MTPPHRRTVLVVDGANVVGARPDGWWKDRAGAAARLHDALLHADVPQEEIVLVLEGQAKQGVRPGGPSALRVVHAAKDGDSEIRRQARLAVEAGHDVAVVTADRALAANVAPARVLSPTWLLDLMG